MQVGLVVVLAYGSYLAADAVQMSGIVSVIFAGMAMKAYVTPNLSEPAQEKIYVSAGLLPRP